MSLVKKQVKPKKVLALCIAFIAIALLWTFDPNVWRVRSRFPSAVIHDWNDFGWLLPGFLHSWEPFSHGLYEGRYLDIEITNKDVDIIKLADVPFVVLSFSHCKVTGLENLDRMRIGNNRSISLRDCDVSGNPSSVIRGVPDPHHATYEIGGP